MYMIIAYYRPQTIEEALKLLSAPNSHPLGGGTVLSRSTDESIAAVDLQALSLDSISKSGSNLSIGATVTLQTLLESSLIPFSLKTALKLEAPLNQRSVGTVAGALVACDGRSPFAAVMLAMDARLTVEGGQSTVFGLGEILPLRYDILKNKLITKIEISLRSKLAFETVARSPADKPIVYAALAKWLSGRTRLVIGGWGKAPTLASDGNEDSGIESAAQNSAQDSTDEWAGAEYRSIMSAVLAKRCLENISLDKI
jgi:CO/xanthine dehydrogenase FAD-binding subunit